MTEHEEKYFFWYCVGTVLGGSAFGALIYWGIKAIGVNNV